MPNKARILWLSVLLSGSLVCFFPNHRIGYYGPVDSEKRVSSEPLITGDTFRAHCDHVFDEAVQRFSVHTVRHGDTIFVNGNLLYNFIERVHPHITKPYILVSHNSDVSIPNYWIDFLEDPKLLKWFGVNTMLMKHPKLEAIPLGIENGSFGKIDTFQEMRQNVPSYEERDIRPYINFSFKTNPLLRGFVWQIIQRTVNDCMVVREKKEFKDFLQDMKQFRYIVSPAGYGMDCHRHWEALLMGAIPIIQHSTIDELFDELPVILVHDWGQVTEEFLEKEYVKLQQKKMNYHKLSFHYWWDRIRNFQQAIRMRN